MNATRWLLGAVFLVLTATADAHAHLTASVPADGSSGNAPEQIVLSFSEAARLTALTLERQGEEPRKISSLPTTAASRVTVPMPKLAAGAYRLTWRALGADGHVTSGTLHFTVAEAAKVGEGGR